LTLPDDSALTVEGSAAGDIVVLGAAQDTLILGGGDDQVIATAASLGQADALDGGSGFDTLVISASGIVDLPSLGQLTGFEQIVLQAPTHVIARDGTDVTVIGSSSDDTVELGNGIDRVALGDGSDTILAKSGNLPWDSLDGGDGQDTLVLQTGGPYELGGLTKFASIEVIRFAEGSSLGSEVAHLVMHGYSAIILGSSGSDKVSLAGGVETVQLGDGDDLVRIGGWGLNAADQIDAGAGVDLLRLIGGGVFDLTAVALLDGFEQIRLDEGGTVIMRNGGVVAIEGRAVADTVIHGSGIEQLNLGDGFDTADYSRSTGAVVVNLATGSASGGYAQGDQIVGVEGVVGSGFNDRLFGSNGGNAMQGGAGKDGIMGAGGADTLDGGDDNDNLLGEDDDDLLMGGSGHDTLDGGAGADTMLGGDGGDTYFVDNAGDDVIEQAGTGIDVVISTTPTYTLPDDVENLGLDTGAITGIGNSGKNRLTGNDADNVLMGEGDSDRLHGGGGADSLVGGDGRDTLIGGAGTDALVGGADRDTFSFANGDTGVGPAARDVIEDFRRVELDKIDLKEIDANTLAGNDQAFTFIGSNAFSNTAGELRFQHEGADTLIQGDTNGDGVADIEILLQATAGVAPVNSDFLL
jgi:Ca2+-binding RTX toxin-like protein